MLMPLTNQNFSNLEAALRTFSRLAASIEAPEVKALEARLLFTPVFLATSLSVILCPARCRNEPFIPVIIKPQNECRGQVIGMAGRNPRDTDAEPIESIE